MIIKNEATETHELIRNEWWMTQKTEVKKLFGVKWYTRTVSASIKTDQDKEPNSIGFSVKKK